MTGEIQGLNMTGGEVSQLSESSRLYSAYKSISSLKA